MRCFVGSGWVGGWVGDVRTFEKALLCDFGEVGLEEGVAVEVLDLLAHRGELWVGAVGGWVGGLGWGIGRVEEEKVVERVGGGGRDVLPSLTHPPTHTPTHLEGLHPGLENGEEGGGAVGVSRDVLPAREIKGGGGGKGSEDFLLPCALRLEVLEEREGQVLVHFGWVGVGCVGGWVGWVRNVRWKSLP